MYITITSLLEETTNGILIEFQTELGTGRGLWWAYNRPPQIDQGYVVELDISDDLNMGDNIEIVDSEEYMLRWQNGAMLIQGKINVVWDDGSGVSIDIRAPKSNGSICLGLPQLCSKLNHFVRIRAENLTISDTNI